jgi:hypothetical protein
MSEAKPGAGETPVSFRCVGCRRVLGLGWPGRLEVGPAAFKKNVTIECVACGAKNRWYPSAQAAPTQGQKRPEQKSGLDGGPSTPQNAPHTRTE